MIDKSISVKHSAYMNFKKATDGLLDRISHEQLAEALGVSVASIRQARLSESAKAHRQPPAEWEQAVIRLAQKRALHYKLLVEALEDKLQSRPRSSDLKTR
jgi:hypothetical protein